MKGLGEMKACLDKQVVLQETTDARISKIEQRIVEIETQLQDLTASAEANKANEEEESAGDNKDEDSVREEEMEAMEEDETDDATSQHPDGESAQSQFQNIQMWQRKCCKKEKQILNVPIKDIECTAKFVACHVMNADDQAWTLDCVTWHQLLNNRKKKPKQATCQLVALHR